MDFTAAIKIVTSSFVIIAILAILFHLPQETEDSGAQKEEILPPKSKIVELPPSSPFLIVENVPFSEWIYTLEANNLVPTYNAEIDLPFYKGTITFKDLIYAEETNGLTKYYGQFEHKEEQNNLLGKFELEFPKDGHPSLNMELFSGRIVMPNGNASRISGSFKLSEHDGISRVNGTLQIGALTYGGLPFQGVQIDLSGTQHQTVAEISAKVSGHEGTVLQANGLFQGQELLNLEGLLSVQSPYSLISTISTMAAGQDMILGDHWLEIPPLTLIFTETSQSSADKRRFSLRLENMDNDFRGLLVHNLDTKILRLAVEVTALGTFSLNHNIVLSNGRSFSKVFADLSLNNRNDDSFGYAN